ncbi:MAG: glycoside hydrolase family 15 protein, partial [Egibacteraceae bacterium]
MTDGELDVEVQISPWLEYGLTTPRWRIDDGRWYVRADPVGLRLSADIELTADGGNLTAVVHCRRGDRLEFALAYDPPYGYVEPLWMSPSQALADTCQGWRSWAGQHTGYQGLYAEQVRRSSLVLQGLTYQKSGAVVAVATASVPKQVGRARNGEQRFAWV